MAIGDIKTFGKTSANVNADVFATLTYYPATETFTTGTNVAVRDTGGKQASFVIQKRCFNENV